MADEVNNNTEDVGEAVVVDSVSIAYHYDPDANPNGAFFPGVPRGPLTQEQFDALPPYLQRSIAASPMYVAADAEEDGEAPAKPKAKSKAKAKE